MSELAQSAEKLLNALKARGMMVGVAESCTGGMIASAMTDIPGSSAMLERGFVTYSNEAKTDMLGVSASLIAQHGAVSEEVARAMVHGVLAHAPVQCAIAVTGVAGPGQSEKKPAGLVHHAVALADGTVRHAMRQFTGDRHAVRRQAACFAMQLALDVLNEGETQLA